MTPVGNVAAVQSIASSYLEGTRLYYQQNNGAIVQTAVTGPFTNGTSTSIDVGLQIVPPGQAMLGTPIAACSIDSGSTAYTEVCVYMIQSKETLIQLYTLKLMSSFSLLPINCLNTSMHPQLVSKVVQNALPVSPSPDSSV